MLNSSDYAKNYASTIGKSLLVTTMGCLGDRYTLQWNLKWLLHHRKGPLALVRDARDMTVKRETLASESRSVICRGNLLKKLILPTQ